MWTRIECGMWGASDHENLFYGMDPYTMLISGCVCNFVLYITSTEKLVRVSVVCKIVFIEAGMYMLGPKLTPSQFRNWDGRLSQFRNWANLSQFQNWDQKWRPVPALGRVNVPVPELDAQFQNWAMTFVPPQPPFQHQSPFWHQCQNGDCMRVPVMALVPCRKT
jgi:hypothetical protein